MSIKLENVTKYYGEQKAVDSISFEVKSGEITGFLGPNGAGKTTTMKMIASYIAPNEGEIWVNDLNVNTQSSLVKQKIGYLPENNPLYLDMYVIEYLEFVAKLQGVPKVMIEQRIIEMVVLCGLNEEKHKRIGELSKGYRQRVGLAQALIHDPDILILDEPTTGLDPNQIVEIRNLIRSLGKEKTVLLSSHILPEVEAACDRILIINQGKIVASGTAESLRNRGQNTELVNLSLQFSELIEVEMTSSDFIFTQIKELSGVTSIESVKESPCRFSISTVGGVDTRIALFNLCIKNNWIITEMTPVESSLEDIFRELTVRVK